MNKFNLLLLFILSLFIFSCGSNNGSKKSDFSIQLNENKSQFSLDDKLQASILNKKNRSIDSVSFYFGDLYLKSSKTGKDFSLNLENALLGNHTLKAIVYTEEVTDTITTDIKILNSKAPVVYTYEIINSYPHDITSYTQGLEFDGDILYESIGQYGESKLRKLDLESGEVLKEIKLDDQYFAEGLTVLDDKLYQLTWQEGEGFIYDLETFERTGTFGYNQSKEGWGLCNNGEKIFKSDGTEKIWILDPETLAEQSYIQPTTHKSVSTKFNELEWVNGKIYANTYQKDGVAIINPENGAIEGLINFKDLRNQVTQHDKLDVLNGIAYNPEEDRLYVTGKNWDKIFEVKIIQK
ncbi:glutaminyl-peptide cyclotransferase [Christiangramia sabulilitoris]|uniref:Glutaminyl-peptide cyclotransferase n=1 Tax=Christiangramia sabulilitoris TaxID=2583991 RepID=A0A550I2U6_9FLAO|nr:glutaminyl-peptide cyclotransferase [Christiangramia sabulilitoris]TRO65303.1 glutaminyl-peptide cyclotransferase [Christiangramia sabulilitoris]